MTANGMRWSGLPVIQDSAGSSTTLATSNLSLTGGSLGVGNSGALIANASSVAVTDVTMTGGASGSLTLTSGSWIVSGQWDTSGAGSTFASGASTVTMSGTSASVATLDANNGFRNLVISGTVTQNTALDVRGSLSVTGRLTLRNGQPALVAPGSMPNRARSHPAGRGRAGAGGHPHVGRGFLVSDWGGEPAPTLELQRNGGEPLVSYWVWDNPFELQHCL